MPETVATDAQMLLRGLLGSNRDNVRAIALACGVSQPIVFDWSSGKYRPDPVSRAVLETDFKIPNAAWEL